MTHFVGFLHSGSRGKFLTPVRELKGVLSTADIRIKRKHELYADDDEGVLDDYAEDLVRDNSLEAIVAAGGPLTAEGVHRLRLRNLRHFQAEFNAATSAYRGRIDAEVLVARGHHSVVALAIAGQRPGE